MSLVLENVTKTFGNHTAVNQLSLDIPESSLFGFLGGNGAGKTTTFRMILSLIDQTDGIIKWNDKPITASQQDLIGYLPEERGLYPKLKVKEQLVYLGRLRGMIKQDALESLHRWLERFQITDYLDKKVEELSKGNQQKIQFISAVLHAPPLLILDEPFTGLDPINIEMLKEAVVDLNRAGSTIVFSSHQMEHVEELCKSLCILRKGEAVVKGNLKEIKRSFGKKNVFIAAEEDLSFLREAAGVVKFKQSENGVQLQVEEEAVSQQILAALQGKQIFIRQFALEEPSLNDIFIDKVGEHYA